MSEVTKDETYNAVVDRARLLEVMLASTSFDVSPDFRDEQDASDKFFDENIVMTHYDPAAEMLLGYIQCRIWMNKASDKTLETKPSLDEAFEKSLFSISAKYFVAFKIEGSHEKGCVDSFYERTAPFTAWPYFRALVAQLAAAANLEIPVLPIKRVLVPFKSGGGYTRADAATD